MLTLYQYRQAAERILRINGLLGLSNEFFYLVIGEKKAALIDTGYGFGDLAAFVKSRTGLPVIVLCTHGHGDHTGGCGAFEEVYLCREDWEMAEAGYEPEKLNETARSLLEGAGVYTGPDGVFAPETPAPRFRPICDGETFDLGGVTLEAITMPGHSPGCVSFLYREGRILFSGDNCGPQPLIMVPGSRPGSYSSLPLEVFSRSLKKLRAREGEFDRIFNCHKTGELPLSCFHGVQDAVEDVLSGRCEGVPVTVFGGKVGGVFSARGLDPERIMELPDGFSGDVIFARDNLYCAP